MVYVYRYLDQKPDIYRGICSNRDKHGFEAELHLICFGQSTVHSFLEMCDYGELNEKFCFVRSEKRQQKVSFSKLTKRTKKDKQFNLTAYKNLFNIKHRLYTKMPSFSSQKNSHHVCNTVHILLYSLALSYCKQFKFCIDKK